MTELKADCKNSNDINDVEFIKDLLKKEIFTREDCLRVAEFWIKGEEFCPGAQVSFVDRESSKYRLSNVIQRARVDGCIEATTREQELVEALEGVLNICTPPDHNTYQAMDALDDIEKIVKTALDKLKVTKRPIRELAKEHGFDERTKAEKRKAFELNKGN